MANATAVKTATGVPNGYVEHVRELSEQGKRVRAAYASGEIKKRTRNRKKLTRAQEQSQKNAIVSALSF